MQKIKSALFLFLMAATGSVFAALPAVVGTTITSVQTDALAAIDLVWPVVITLLGAFILIKVVKRAMSKV